MTNAKGDLTKILTYFLDYFHEPEGVFSPRILATILKVLQQIVL